MTTATAHPNIALVKYWGKQAKPGNLPVSPNLSITLSELETTTSVTDLDGEQDEFWLNDEHVADQKVDGFLSKLRQEYTVGPLMIRSQNNFPTGAGLASSASGFAALITAINSHANLGMNVDLMSDWARQGSASAARSMFAGFVALLPPLWRSHPIAPPEHWPLHTVVAITSSEKKAVGSSEGMERSRLTSPFFKNWVENGADDFAVASDAVNQRDFDALAQISESSCLKMHSVMLTSLPTLSYWNSATIGCMDVVRELRANGTPVFFTIDAGPQVKAICEATSVATVEQALAAVPGVLRTLSCAMGEGARVTSS
jgi:diphosphomevalonate decarboxylase